MLLTPPDVALFFKLDRALMFFVNQRLKVVPDDIASPDAFAALLPKVRLKIRDALNANVDLIEAFVGENPAHLPNGELEVVRSWRQLVTGKFYVFRELKKYTVFLAAERPAIAYGVLALTQSFEEMIGPHLPVLVETVLLPFKDQIVYDGMMNRYRISFGPGSRRSLNESFREAKARHGIVTSLPMDARAAAPAATAPSARPRPQVNPKEALGNVLKIIVGMIDQFCKEQLTDKYAVFCRRLAEKLARKRPSPLLSGNPNTWASGIVRTIGWVNFLHDKSQTPHMRLSDIDAAFGIGASTGAAKQAAILRMLKIHPLDPEWTLPSQLDGNPRALQMIALRRGLIPLFSTVWQKGQD